MDHKTGSFRFIVRHIFTGAVALVGNIALAGQSDSGILQFQFKVKDEQGRAIPKVGTATVLSPTGGNRDGAHPRLFFVTSAHVAQGDRNDWRVQKAGADQPGDSIASAIRGSVTDPLCDLALIGIDPSQLGSSRDVKPFAYVSHEYGGGKSLVDENGFVGYIPTVIGGNGGGGSLYGVRPNESERTGQRRILAYPAALQSWFGHSLSDLGSNRGKNFLGVEPGEFGSFVLMPDWAQRNEAEDGGRERIADLAWDTFAARKDLIAELQGSQGNGLAPMASILDASIGYEAFGNRIWAPARIPPGTSGAPLIKPFYRDRRMWPEVRGFGSGYVRNMTGSTFCSDAALLNLIDRYQEGRHEVVGKGQWGYRNGVLALDYEPGKKRSDLFPLSGNASVDLNGAPSKDQYAPPGNDQYASPASGSQSFWKEHGILPSSIEWDGKPALGFKVSLKKNGPTFYLAPNHASVDFVQRFGSAFSVEPVVQGSSLAPLLAKRLSSGSGSFQSPGAYAFGSQTFKGALLDHNASSGKLRVLLHDPDSGEKIEFELNPDGSRVGCGHPYAETMFEIVGNKGGNYIVDLHELFFMDLERIQVPENRPQVLKQAQLMMEQSPTRVALLLQSEAKKGGYISFRKKGEGITRRVQFNETQPNLVRLEPMAAASSCSALSASKGVGIEPQIKRLQDTVSRTSGGHDR